MATIFTEGFDKYGPASGTFGSFDGFDVSTLLTQNEWTAVGNSSDNIGSWVIVPGLSETGYAVAVINGFGTPFLSKTLPGSLGRIMGGFRFETTLQASGGFAFNDSINRQVTITVDALSGLISLWGGTYQTGTLLGRSILSVSARTIHYLEFDITFGVGSLGSFQVWLDGVSIINGIGSTQQDGCLPSANIIMLLTASAGAGNDAEFAYDDIYIFDSTGSINNQVLLSNPRIETQFPKADHQTEFTNNGNLIGSPFSAVPSITGPQGNPGNNAIFLRKYRPAVNCTLNAVGMLPGQSGANATVNYKAVAYADNAGAAGALMSVGAQRTSTLAHVPAVAQLGAPQALTGGTDYWIGFIIDQAVFLSLENVTDVNGYVAANTYGAGAPNPAPSMTANQPSWVLYGLCTGAAVNWVSEDVNPAPGDISSIISDTPGIEDLYQFPALSTDILTVYTMAVKANAKVVASGVRTIDLQTLSGGTEGSGSATGLVPQTSYGWLDSYFDHNPNGNVVWTPAAVTASFSGPKVAT